MTRITVQPHDTPVEELLWYRAAQEQREGIEMTTQEARDVLGRSAERFISSRDSDYARQTARDMLLLSIHDRLEELQRHVAGLKATSEK